MRHLPYALVLLAAAVFTSPAAPAGELRGMTWGRVNNAGTVNGVVFVSCHGTPASPEGSCDPYIGDTSCHRELPVLCVRPAGRPRPAGLFTPPAGGTAAMDKSFYAGWAGGDVALTAAIAGSAFASQLAADAYCQRQLGAGWRMAEFHDGVIEGHSPPADAAAKWRDAPGAHGGWAFYASGELKGDSRFWVAIDDQRANCWNSVGPESPPVMQIGVPRKVPVR